MYFRGPHGRLTLPNESPPSLNNQPTYPIRQRTGQNMKKKKTKTKTQRANNIRITPLVL